jgi:hypothetical protein
VSALYERTPRRMHCLRRIVANGDRQVFEFAWQVTHGAPFDETLERFAELEPGDCRGADVSELMIGPRIVRACH